MAEGLHPDRPRRLQHPLGRKLAFGVTAQTLLEVEALQVGFPSRAGVRNVVAGIGYALAPGRTLGVVGESGCGKSMTALALMGLLPTPNRVGGSIRLGNIETVGLPDREHRHLRGKRMAMIFQEPMTALNPVVPVGEQIAEMLIVHDGLAESDAAKRAVA